jgi:hypothetical protein
MKNGLILGDIAKLRNKTSVGEINSIGEKGICEIKLRYARRS